MFLICSFSFLLFPATPFVAFQLIRKGNALTTILPLRYTYYYDYEICCSHFCNRTCHRLRCASSITQPGRVARCMDFTGGESCIAFTPQVSSGFPVFKTDSQDSED